MKGTRVYNRARELRRIATHDDGGRPVAIVWWRDAKYASTGKQWLSWQRDGRCLRRVQYASASGPARIAAEWSGALAETAGRPRTVTGAPFDAPDAAPESARDQAPDAAPDQAPDAPAYVCGWRA